MKMPPVLENRNVSITPLALKLSVMYFLSERSDKLFANRKGSVNALLFQS